jgi:hypothetical protein
MRFRTYEEATAFIKGLLKAKEDGKRDFVTAKLDSVPQWAAKGKTPEPKLDGSRIVAVYMAYRPPTERQKKAAKGAKYAGVDLQQIEGRLVDVRRVSDGTVQVLFTNGLRNEGEAIPWRGPNVDKGILCFLAVDEGLGEPIEDITKRVPEELVAKLKAMKAGKVRNNIQPATKEQVEQQQAALPALVVARVKATIDVPAVEAKEDDEGRVKLK